MKAPYASSPFSQLEPVNEEELKTHELPGFDLLMSTPKKSSKKKFGVAFENRYMSSSID